MVSQIKGLMYTFLNKKLEFLHKERERKKKKKQLPRIQKQLKWNIFPI